MAHHKANQLILWLTMKQTNLYYGSPQSQSNCIMTHNEADQITRELCSTTKQIKLYFGSSRGRSKCSYIMARNESDRVRTQNKRDKIHAVKSQHIKSTHFNRMSSAPSSNRDLNPRGCLRYEKKNSYCPLYTANWGTSVWWPSGLKANPCLTLHLLLTKITLKLTFWWCPMPQILILSMTW
jgi:hypothetical protein